jgi:hypothetical protein
MRTARWKRAGTFKRCYARQHWRRRGQAFTKPHAWSIIGYATRHLAPQPGAWLFFDESLKIVRVLSSRLAQHIGHFAEQILFVARRFPHAQKRFVFDYEDGRLCSHEIANPETRVNVPVSDTDVSGAVGQKVAG